VSEFLTAQWRYLAMLHYAIEPEILKPLVPEGTELDLWQDQVAYVGLVGFRFLATRVMGLSIPLHRDFTEVNLRFYVRRRAEDGVRRGVVFIRELVPQPAIAWAARLAYNEPYRTVPIRHEVPGEGMAGRYRYEWHNGGDWEGLTLTARPPGRPMANGSVEEFLVDRAWGYTRQRDGGTIEYHVRHPRWLLWTAGDVSLDCSVTRYYGPEFVPALSRPPELAYVADGSEVTVSAGVRIT